MNIKELSKFVVMLKGGSGVDEIYNLNLSDLMKIDEEHMEAEYNTVSVLYSVIATMVAYAQTNETKAKFELEYIQVQLDDEIRKSLKNKEEKVTEKLIESTVKLDNRYHKAFEKWLELRKQYLILKQLESALLVKKDILLSLAADRRAIGG